jgi:hypothetical protein
MVPQSCLWYLLWLMAAKSGGCSLYAFLWQEGKKATAFEKSYVKIGNVHLQRVQLIKLVLIFLARNTLKIFRKQICSALYPLRNGFSNDMSLDISLH